MSLTDLVIPPWVKPVAIGMAVLGFYLFAHHEGALSEKSLWDAEKVKEQTIAMQQEAANRSKEKTLGNTSTTIQNNATDAIKGIYEYYKSHPITVAADSNGLCHYEAFGGGMSPSSSSSSDSKTNTTNNGHTTASNQEEVRIEPNLIPRCAETTLQALSCREYVLELEKVLK